MSTPYEWRINDIEHSARAANDKVAHLSGLVDRLFELERGLTHRINCLEQELIEVKGPAH